MAEGEPTLGELGRLIEREIQGIRTGIRDDLALMRTELTKFVLAEVYSSEHAAFERRMDQVERAARDLETHLIQLKEAFDAAELASERRRAEERRARLHNLVLPLVGMLLSAGITIWAVLARG